jgi:hypothetical protein
MQNRILTLGLAIILAANSQTFSQNVNQDSTYKKCFLGSSFFMLGNFSKTNKPDFAQINFGYRITPKDVVSIEAKTWKYAWSLGIPPFSKSFEAPEEEFPGCIREIGIALAYQRFWYKGLYTSIHVMNARQTFVDESGNKIKNGYQMFNTYRLGYQIKLFKNKFFIEPSLAVTHRPIQSKMPQAFAALNDKYPKYLIGEPGLHFGFNF